MLPRSAHLIFNPIAGQGNSDQDLNDIRTLLGSEIELTIHFTTPDKGAAQFAREAVEQGAEAVIVAGGDGTLSAAASALSKTNIPLGVIPRGTANAFVHALGIPDTIFAACDTILTGYTRQVDTVLCNGKAIVLVAGIGFEAEMVQQADRDLKDRLGQLAYIVAGIDQIRDPHPFKAEIETEQGVIEATATAVTIANASPPSSILAQGPAGIIADDGLLDITIMTPENRTDIVTASYELLRSAIQKVPAEHKGISYFRTPWVKVKTDPPQKIAVDGEIDGETPLEAVCVPQGLTIFAPEDVEP